MDKEATMSKGGRTMTQTKNNSDLSIFFVPANSVSPGGKAAIGLILGDEVRTWCIGSGGNFRDAKASALKNVRNILGQLTKAEEDTINTISQGAP